MNRQYELNLLSVQHFILVTNDNKREYRDYFFFQCVSFKHIYDYFAFDINRQCMKLSFQIISIEYVGGLLKPSITLRIYWLCSDKTKQEILEIYWLFVWTIYCRNVVTCRNDCIRLALGRAVLFTGCYIMKVTNFYNKCINIWTMTNLLVF